MKFELVEFYPIKKELLKNVNSKAIGTVHLYVCDCDLDLRGINVTKKGTGYYFNVPHFNAIDEEGNRVRYPLFRWNNPKTQKEMLDFLHKEVKPKIKEMMKK